MNGDAAIVEILKREGVEYLFCFPANTLIEAAAVGGIRPIIARTERTLVNMADGYSRVSNGRRIGVCTVQDGPGIENAFAGVAQAYADSSPILFVPGQAPRPRWGIRPDFNVEEHYRGVTKWVARAQGADQIPDLMRRAFTRLKSGRPGPVMLGIPRDVATEELGGALEYTPAPRIRAAAEPQAVAEAVRALLAAKRPLLHVGQGVHYAGAWEKLKAFAELLGAPVITTLAGKSAFPENHPLSAGTAGYTVAGAARHFLDRADMILGIGCSFSRSVLTTPIPPGKTLIQLTVDEFDLNNEYPVAHPLLGDAGLGLKQLFEEVKQQSGANGPIYPGFADEVQSVKEVWLATWMPKLTSDEAPINPYRVVWDLNRTLDRTRTILTHDSGNPRDQVVPFYEAIIPRGYLGWGKSTQLGYSLGLTMGAKMAAPDKTAVTVMGDAAFGMCGMDVETAVREKIPILIVLLNNGAMGGYEKHLPVATERYGSKFLTGQYAAVAAGLGAYSERVERPAEIVPAIRRGLEANASGRPALLEMITREEQAFSK
jgi:thiamine pyrophosphate-dependent acetolactate synthase large subunit-like protein